MPTTITMTGEVRAFMKVVNSGSRLISFLLLDHAARPGHPVGGIKEKVLSAHRAQVTKVFLPWVNWKDLKQDVE